MILTPKERAMLTCAVRNCGFRPSHETYCTLMTLVAYGLMEPDDNKPDVYLPTAKGEQMIETEDA